MSPSRTQASRVTVDRTGLIKTPCGMTQSCRPCKCTCLDYLSGACSIGYHSHEQSESRPKTCSDTSHIAQPTGACRPSAFWLTRQVNLAWTFFVSGNCYRGGAQAKISVEKADLFEPDIHYVRRGSDVLDTSVSSGSCTIDNLGFPHRAGQKLHVCISFRQPRRYQPVSLSVSLVPGRGFMGGSLGNVWPVSQPPNTVAHWA